MKGSEAKYQHHELKSETNRQPMQRLPSRLDMILAACPWEKLTGWWRLELCVSAKEERNMAEDCQF